MPRQPNSTAQNMPQINEDEVLHSSTSNFVAQMSKQGLPNQNYINNNYSRMVGNQRLGNDVENKTSCEVSDSQLVYSDVKQTYEQIEEKKAGVKLSLRHSGNSNKAMSRHSSRSRGNSMKNKVAADKTKETEPSPFKKAR